MLRTITFGLLFLVSCSSYPFTVAIPIKGIMGDVAELYEGETVGQTNGKITLAAVSTGTRCQGNYKYTFVSPDGIGSSGIAKFQCSDGRTASLYFMTETEEKGYGFGKDSKGAPAVFTFGKSDFDTVEIYKRYVQKN